MSRTPPPPLEIRCPDCSICGDETYYEDGFCCDRCGATWDRDLREQPGEWMDDADEQCGDQVQPWRDNAAFPSIAHIVWTCLLAEGHTGKHNAGSYHEWGDDTTYPPPVSTVTP